MNRVAHFEIPAENLDRAKKFYSENDVLAHTGPTDDKGMPQDKGFINGGERSRRREGCVGEILDIPNVGRYARVQDTEGNVIGIIKPFIP